MHYLTIDQPQWFSSFDTTLIDFHFHSTSLHYSSTNIGYNLTVSTLRKPTTACLCRSWALRTSTSTDSLLNGTLMMSYPAWCEWMDCFEQLRLPEESEGGGKRWRLIVEATWNLPESSSEESGTAWFHLLYGKGDQGKGFLHALLTGLDIKSARYYTFIV